MRVVVAQRAGAAPRHTRCRAQRTPRRPRHAPPAPKTHSQGSGFGLCLGLGSGLAVRLRVRVRLSTRRLFGGETREQCRAVPRRQHLRQLTHRTPRCEVAVHLARVRGRAGFRVSCRVQGRVRVEVRVSLTLALTSGGAPGPPRYRVAVAHSHPQHPRESSLPAAATHWSTARAVPPAPGRRSQPRSRGAAA